MFKLVAAVLIFAPAIASASLCGEDSLIGRFNPLKPWLYGTPYGATVGMRTPTELHANMMVQSYLKAQNGKQIETGTVFLLDRNGAVMDETGIIEGAYGNVGHLNDRAMNLIFRNFSKLSEIDTAVVGHTHPYASRQIAPGQEHLAGTGLADTFPVAVHKFSEGDNRQDEKLRARLDNSEATRHIHLESFIVYFETGRPILYPHNPLWVKEHIRVKARTLKGQ